MKITTDPDLSAAKLYVATIADLSDLQAPKVPAVRPGRDEKSVRRLALLTPPKQRHTAMQICRRLRPEHGYQGSYDQVRRYVGQHRRDWRETFPPLAHDPDQSLEAVFGHIDVDFPDGRKQIPVLITFWSFSNDPFVMATPSEGTEAILAGMVEAFNFFGCVLHEVYWDNSRTVRVQNSNGCSAIMHHP